MSKTELLLYRMRSFRKLLRSEVEKDSSLSTAIDRLQPLFDAIERGEVMPPVDGQCDGLFHSENERYGFGSDMYECFSKFRSALEDWPSKSWFPKD